MEGIGFERWRRNALRVTCTVPITLAFLFCGGCGGLEVRWLGPLLVFSLVLVLVLVLVLQNRRK